MRYFFPALAVLASVGLLVLDGCGQAAPPAPLQEVSVTPVNSLPADADDPAWQQAPEYLAKLILQDMVEPRQLQATTPEVKVRALMAGSEMAIRLAWSDATLNDTAVCSHFSDACAVQLPAKIEPALPAPQMGEAGKGVEMTYWNAAWQAMVNGREDSVKAFYPNAAIDHYPFEAAAFPKDSPEQQAMALRYAPARALNNKMSGPRTSPVQDLNAEGPGTITPAAETLSKGVGKRSADGWVVVITRRLPAGFGARQGTQVAFAVWDGATDEVGARKMRSVWIPLNPKAQP